MDTHRITAQEQALIDAAKAVRRNAHAPYSGYHVGSALVDENGNVHTGCNVENSAFPEGTCAEANAIGGRDDIEACTPCGGCRQNILEFADEHTRIILIGDNGRIDSYSIDELLPASFRLK